MSTFTYWGEELTYCDHPYNDSALNERSVEIPIAQAFVARQHGRGLEVGNVLSHYGPIEHTVVDLYEEGDGVLNVDVLDHRPCRPYDWLVSISTIEHIEGPRAFAALVHMLERLAPDQDAPILVTVPLNVNAALDLVLLGDAVIPRRACTFVREGPGWRQTPEPEWRPYGAPGWAGSVWIGEW